LELDAPSPGFPEVVALHEQMHPNVTVTMDSVPSAATDAFESGTLQGVGALDLSGAGWVSSFPPSVLDMLIQNGRLIGVPLGITRQNVAYWNLRVLRTLPAPLNAIPKGVQGFTTWLTGVSAAGYTHPLCFGLKDQWVNAHILFEDIVPAIAGPDYSRLYWSGRDTQNAQLISDALDFAAQNVVPYIVSDAFLLSMSQGIDRLMTVETNISQQCIMAAMGDWGGAQLESAPDSFVAGTDFDASGWPGTEDLLDFSGPEALSANAATQHTSEVLALLDTFASEQGQLLYATKANVIPTRSLTPASQAQLPYLVQVDMKPLTSGTAQLPGYKLIAKRGYDTITLGLQSQQFLQTGDKTALLAWMATAYPTLQ
jgi:ABC-type glycerol-3-phosphate transport system substrate-binding protein